MRGCTLAIVGVLAACRDASSEPEPKPKPNLKPTASAETAADVELPMPGVGLSTTMPATWIPELSAQPGIEGFPVALGDRAEDAVRRLPAETRAADVVMVGVELSYGTPARVEAIELPRIQERGTWLRDRLKQRWGAPAVMPRRSGAGWPRARASDLTERGRAGRSTPEAGNGGSKAMTVAIALIQRKSRQVAQLSILGLPARATRMGQTGQAIHHLGQRANRLFQALGHEVEHGCEPSHRALYFADVR